jgi:very-short-patch-repair endonuclease
MASVEARIMDLAARQHGLVTRSQLLRAGLGHDAVKYRIHTKRLLPVHRGVYRVGPVAAPLAHEMAAVLACGPAAVLSRVSAAILWDLLPAERGTVVVDVTVRSRNRRRREGIRVRCDPRLEPDEVTHVQRIPTTAPTRTVFDLAAVVGSRELDRVLARADRQGLVDQPALSSLLLRYSARAGIRRLRKLLEGGGGRALTRSEAEERFLALVRRAELPRPETNVSLRGYEVDFLWPAGRLVVEVDGFAFHSSRSSFESDRSRDAALTAKGYRVMRVTWRQVVRRPEATVARLAQALGMVGWRR